MTIEAFLDVLEAKPKFHWTERYQQVIRDLYLSELKSRLRYLGEVSIPQKEMFTRAVHDSMTHFKEYLQKGIELYSESLAGIKRQMSNPSCRGYPKVFARQC